MTQKNKNIITGVLILLTLVTALFSKSIFLISMRLGIGAQLSYLSPYILLFVFLVLLVIFIVKLPSKTVIKIALIIGLFAIPISIISLLHPFYPEDFSNRYKTVALSGDSQNTSGADIKCYLLVTCPYCEIASEHLNILYQAGKIKDIEFIYYARPATADSLVKVRNIEVPYSTIESDSIFFTTAGVTFPAIQYRSENNLIQWIGSDVNLACFDYLIQEQK